MQRGIIAIENNKPDCIEKMKELTRDDDRILIKALKTKISAGLRKTADLCIYRACDQLRYAAIGCRLYCE